MTYLGRMGTKTTVLYNDTCPVCSREVDGYRRMTAREGLDITYCGLSGGGHSSYGLSDEDAARRFHLIRDGELLGGMAAFAALWQDIPRLRWLARLVRLPGLRPLVDALYDRAMAPLLYRMHLRRQRRRNLVSRGSPPR